MRKVVQWFNETNSCQISPVTVEEVLFGTISISHETKIKRKFNFTTLSMCKYIYSNKINSETISIHEFINKQEKPQGHWTPPFFPLCSGCKIQHDHSRYEPKWCKFFKLVIYLTFDVFPATPPPPPPTSSLHPSPCDNMNPK